MFLWTLAPVQNLSFFLEMILSVTINLVSVKEHRTVGWHSAVHSPPSLPVLESAKTRELHFGDFFVNRVVFRASPLGIHTKSWKVDLKQKSLSFLQQQQANSQPLSNLEFKSNLQAFHHKSYIWGLRCQGSYC